MPVLKNTWMKQSGNRLTTSRRRNSVTPFKEYLNSPHVYKPNSNFPRDFVFYADLWHSEQQGFGTLANGTGIATPTSLVAGANTVDVTQAGTFTIWLPSIHTGTAASGTAVVTGSPVSLVGGNNTITVTGTGTITITCTDQVVDRSQNAALCSVVGSPVWSNQGRTFVAASSQYIDSNLITLDLTAGMTIISWAKHSAIGAGNERLLSKRDATGATNPFDMFLEGANTRINFVVNETTQVGAIGSVATGTWYMATGTHDLSNIAYFHNGVFVNQTALAAASVTNAFSVKIGVRSNSLAAYMNGTIGEVQIYDHALTAQEISQIYNSTKWRYL